jgi:hypothetical protein
MANRSAARRSPRLLGPRTRYVSVGPKCRHVVSESYPGRYLPASTWHSELSKGLCIRDVRFIRGVVSDILEGGIRGGKVASDESVR